ncbi:M20 family metallopeptidase [Brevibacillus migulae]|uniref:M20 family metallopeptidase n=1 Tax=Brevibacillus migulae TaxID=1644114 RepID=UPI00106EDD00|nr:M20 family metallopeptidase [Brevibacillus migulae]
MNETTNRQISEYLHQHRDEMVADLEQFVKKDSPSNVKRLVDECGQYLQELFHKHLGLQPEVYPQTETGDHLKFTYGHAHEQILILGHFDTVWDQGRLRYRVEGDKIYGPGILDMKSGIIIALWGLKALREMGLSPQKQIVFLCNSDEEIGSPSSRELIETEAGKSAYALVMEPAEAHTGALKTARKGVGIFTLKVHGRTAHAGNHHQEGVSAVEELARQIVMLQELTDYEKGTTVNVGIIQGGGRTNVVPDHAEAHIDVRVSSMEEAERISKAILGMKPILQGASLEISGQLNRPPMVRTETTEALYQAACAVATELGMKLQEASVGGGSDGNFTAALGVPTLDGLGAEGEGLHAEHEHIRADSLPERAALFANLILQL